MSSISLLSPNPSAFSTAEKNDSWGTAVLSYLETAKGVRKLVLELSATVADWMTFYRPHAGLSIFSTQAVHAKNWLALASIPEELVKIAEQSRASYKEKSLGNCNLLANSVASILVATTDMAGTIHQQRIYPLSQVALRNIGILGGIGTFVNGCYDFADSAQMWNESSQNLTGRVQYLKDAQGLAAIGAVGAISDIAYAILVVLTSVTSLVVAPWLLLALGTQSLICTLGGQFYPQLSHSMRF